MARRIGAIAAAVISSGVPPFMVARPAAVVALSDLLAGTEPVASAADLAPSTDGQSDTGEAGATGQGTLFGTDAGEEPS